MSKVYVEMTKEEYSEYQELLVKKEELLKPKTITEKEAIITLVKSNKVKKQVFEGYLGFDSPSISNPLNASKDLIRVIWQDNSDLDLRITVSKQWLEINGGK